MLPTKPSADKRPPLQRWRILYGRRLSYEAMIVITVLALTGNGAQAFKLLTGVDLSKFKVQAETQTNNAYAEAFVDGFKAGREECQ